MRIVTSALLVAAMAATPAMAQRTDENAVKSAEDAFGVTVGHESLGIYSADNIRGFSPGVAGNFRMEGMYFDVQAPVSGRVVAGATLRVGPAAQGQSFPAPTGVVDYVLRDSGNDYAASVVLDLDAYGSVGGELDMQLPIVTDHLSTAIGTAVRRDHFGNGGHVRSFSWGMVPRWRPAPEVEVTGFWGHIKRSDETTQGIYLAQGDFLPGRIRRGKFPGPDWVLNENVYDNYGVVSKAILGSWTIRAGLFRSEVRSGVGYLNLVALDTPTTGERIVAAFPAVDQASTSGELRVSREFAEGVRRHLFTVSMRGREVKNRNGDGDQAEFGSFDINARIAPPRPDFARGAITQDGVRHKTGAFAYSLAWQGLGELTLGAQRSRYVKNVRPEGQAQSRRVTQLWLPSMSIASPLSDRISVYGSYVKGLEDAGSSPSYAANANEILPAIRTSQWDAGVKWTPFQNATVIMGYFNVAKPYLALDQADIYRSIGHERHQGAELSLTAQVNDRLTIVTGAVMGRPRVSKSPLTNEVIGKRPVGQSDFSGQFNVDYSLPFVAEGLSVDGYASYQSRQAGTVDNAVMIDGYATFGVGGRYQWKWGKTPLTLRVQMGNIFNAYSYYAAGSGVYLPIDQRSASAYLVVDF